MEEAAGDEEWYTIALWGYFAMAAIMFVLVNFCLSAPYGRHVRRGWGFSVPVREGWIIMESPALFVMALVYHAGQFHLQHVPHVLLRYSLVTTSAGFRLQKHLNSSHRVCVCKHTCIEYRA